MFTKRLHSKLCQLRRLSSNCLPDGQTESIANHLQRLQAVHGESQNVAGSVQDAHEGEVGNLTGGAVQGCALRCRLSARHGHSVDSHLEVSFNEKLKKGLKKLN